MKKRKKSPKMATEDNYAAKNEEYQAKQQKKNKQLPNGATIAIELKKAKKDQGYSKLPKVKPQKKTAKAVGKGVMC